MVKLLNCYIVKLFFGFLVFLFLGLALKGGLLRVGVLPLGRDLVREAKAATLTAGNLIKGSSPAVYYLGQDGRRYVFLNEKIYKSWYSGFSQVKTISDAELGKITSGGNRLYKPGVRLLKLPSRPEVYEVTEYGVLGWLVNPETAVSRYGANWENLIDDLPEVFFSDYRLGAAMGETAPAPVQAPKKQTGPGSLVIFLSPDIVSASYVKKSTAVPAAAFRFTAGRGSDIKITDLTLNGYVDEAQGNPDFGRGGDADDESILYLKDLAANVYLYDENDNLVAGPVAPAFEGQVYFRNFEWIVPAGASEDLIVKVDFAPGAPFLNNDRFSFDIINAPADVASQDQKGDYVAAVGEKPNGGDNPRVIITIAQSGVLTVETDAGTPDSAIVSMGQKNIEFSWLKFNAEEEDFSVKNISLADISSNYDRSIKKIWISYPIADGSIETKEGDLWIGEVAFRNINFYVPKGGAVLKVLADIKTSTEGAESGDAPGFNLLEKDFEAYGQTSEVIFTKNSFGLGYLKNKTKIPSQMSIRKTRLDASLNPETPIGSAGRGFTRMLKFDLRADAAGPAKIKELTFKINPSDVHTEGQDNDLLEKLVDIAADYGNNIGHGDLHFAENPDTPLGEGYSGDIFYGIYDASIRTVDATPAGLETEDGDYGLLKFTFNYGSEIVIPAGGTRTLIFELNTWGLVYGTQYGAQRVWVELLGDGEKATLQSDNFEWNDEEADATGYLVRDLPIVGRVLYLD